jgi:osmotically-inducible protein OsmY
METNGEQNGKFSKKALKIGIFGAVALGAAVSGFLVSRQGRGFVKDVWNERRRSPLEDRVLDVLWADPKLGKRSIDVVEIEPGVIALSGRLRNNLERLRARHIVAGMKGITAIEDRLEVRPRRS